MIVFYHAAIPDVNRQMGYPVGRCLGDEAGFGG